MNNHCHYCENPDPEALIHVPWIITNEKSELFVLQNVSGHRDCLKSSGRGRLLTVFDLYQRQSVPRNVCSVCSASIADPDEMLVLPYLGEICFNSLLEYSFMQFHKECYHAWKNRGQLEAGLREAVQSGEWEGRGLERLIGYYPDRKRTIPKPL